MIALTIFLALTIAIAYLEAFEDAQKIWAHKPINHGSELIERCIAVVCTGLLLCGLFGLWQWLTLLWVPAAWGAFTIAFRWFLNRMRRKDWRYISPSNVYDWWFLSLGEFNDRDYWIRNWHSAENQFEACIHRAGAIAYVFEAAVLLASLAMYAFIG